MNTNLYHRDLGYPKGLFLKASYSFILNYSNHALKSAKNDRYGEINLPKHISFPSTDIFEVETMGLTPVKIVVRIKYDEKFDLCLVIMLLDGLVKTVWLNKIEDEHSTLNASKYTKI